MIPSAEPGYLRAAEMLRSGKKSYPSICGNRFSIKSMGYAMLDFQ